MLETFMSLRLIKEHRNVFSGETWVDPILLAFTFSTKFRYHGSLDP